MIKVGDKIKEIRISKGMSQEELALCSNVNVRTIQRIEKHENTPHGKTLQLIGEALNVQPEDLLEFNQLQDTNLLSWFYFSILSSLFLPLGNILVPLILWLTNKNNILKSNQLGKHIVCNQVIISAISYPMLYGLILSRINDGIGNILYLLGIFLFGAIHIYNFVYAIYGGVRARQGQLIQYPFLRTNF